MIKGTVRTALQSLMAERGLSQNQLARDSGVTQSTISRILAEANEPTFPVAAQIASALGVSLDAFAGKKIQKK
jgi:transcriptional regulator with XRE-family HTH domain